MDQRMVMTAEHRAIFDAGFSAALPPIAMVVFKHFMRCVASGDDASAIPGEGCLFDWFREEPLGPAYVEHLAFAAEDDGDDFGFAQQLAKFGRFQFYSVGGHRRGGCQIAQVARLHVDQDLRRDGFDSCFAGRQGGEQGIEPALSDRDFQFAGFRGWVSW